ncbi:MAG: DUF4398 domain-containing protein [Bacillota bacterium]
MHWEQSIAPATRFLAVIVAAAGLFGCAGAPVQEMSDARQALAAAEQAHAEKAASADMTHAQQYLEAAQKALDAGDYSTAREDAQLARQAALRALSLSKAQDINGHSPP